jgi:hypothetical protein
MPRILNLAALAALFAVSALFSPSHSFAQSSSAFQVAPCVTATGVSNGNNKLAYCDPITSSNPMPVTGTIAATIGGFQPTAQGTPIAATTGGVTGTLPGGVSGVAQDVGGFPAYCQFGASATGITNGHYLSGAGAQWAYLVPVGSSQLTCEGVGGTTQINLYGGSGLGVDTGGGGAGASSVTIAAPVGPTATDAASVAVTCNSSGTLCGILSAPPNVAVNGINLPLSGITQGTGQTGTVTALNVVNTPSNSTTIGITPVVSAAAEASHVLKGAAGNLYAAYATNLTSTAGFLVILNATTAPADGAITPLACAPLGASGVTSINYAPGPPGIFSTGITAVVTSAASCFTKTTGVITAFISGSVQ